MFSHRDTCAPRTSTRPRLLSKTALDEVAYACNVDPVALRLADNTVTDLASGHPFSSRHVAECLRQGAERFSWPRRTPDPGSMTDRDGTLVGWGVAAGSYPCSTAAAVARASVDPRQLTILGDGAAWNIATAKFPEATQIVDLFHAREHLHSLTRSLEFVLGDRRDEWLAARLEDPGYGDINGIEAAVGEYPLEGIKKDEAGKELGYFLGNAPPRMRYRWFRSRGLFAGSGVVEASCKTIAGQRLKQAGMHWTVAGADAIIALRCKAASSQREAICNHRHNQTGVA